MANDKKLIIPPMSTNLDGPVAGPGITPPPEHLVRKAGTAIPMIPEPLPVVAMPGANTTPPPDMTKPPQQIMAEDELNPWPLPEGTVIPDGISPIQLGIYRQLVQDSTKIEWLVQGCSDSGNALRLRDLLGDSPEGGQPVPHKLMRWSYDIDRGTWLIWDGKWWVRDTTERVILLAQDMIVDLRKRSKFLEEVCFTMGDVPRGKQMSKVTSFFNLSLSKNSLRSMIELAKPLLNAPASLFDQNPLLLSCTNGTINLASGELQPHNYSDWITRGVHVAYVPNAVSPEWASVVNHVANYDPEVVDYLQVAAGYSITGSTQEKKIFLLHGDTNTGKSLFINTLGSVMGSYASSGSFTSLAAKSREEGGPRSDIARWESKRLVYISEVWGGRRWDSQMVKNVTGATDRLVVAYKFKTEREFRPTFKIWVACNDVPKADHDDSGMWARIDRVPVGPTIERAAIDQRLDVKLASPCGQQSVLAWAVAGAVKWVAQGLTTPAVIEAATEEYRDESNPVKTFADNYVEFGPRCQCTSSDIFLSYTRFCKYTGERNPMSHNKLMRSLVKLHPELEPYRTMLDRGWVGLYCNPAHIEGQLRGE